MNFDFTLPGLGRPQSARPKRVGEAIQRELAMLLLRKVRDPRLHQVTVTSVEMSPDLKRAKVFFIVALGGDSAKARKGLERARGFFRTHIARTLNLRYTPDLIFRQDMENRGADRLEELFAEIARQRNDDGDHS